MTDGIRINVAGDRQVGLRFDTFPDQLYDDLKQEIEALATELYARIELSAPDHTGRLRSQIRLRLFTDKNRITGYVDIAGGKGSQDFAKAGALEYGSRGRPIKVKSHRMGLDHHWALKLRAPETVLVAAYERTPNVPEFAFERGPLAAMQPEVLARLDAVVAAATAKANV